MAFKNILYSLIMLLLGTLAGLGIIYMVPRVQTTPVKLLSGIDSSLALSKPQIVGFLPYWLIDKADKDYTKYLTTLTYFGLTLDIDGKIKKYTNPGEEDPGYTSLTSGRVDTFLQTAKTHNITRSLLVFSSNEDVIGQLIRNPAESARTMVLDVEPLMKKYGFTDLNIDIESVNPNASEEARMNFTTFIKEVKKHMDERRLGTLTIDASPIVLIKPYLINLNEVKNYSDYVVLMTYDYHSNLSFVTGPVAPIGGAGIDAEFDTKTAMNKALSIMPRQQILLGLPLYGYEWETLSDSPRSAVIPESGQSASNRRVEELLASCNDCKVGKDERAQESYVTFQDKDTGAYHQVFYPDQEAVAAKLKLVQVTHVGGVALWALGYEGNTLLNPLEAYKNAQ